MANVGRKTATIWSKRLQLSEEQVKRIAEFGKWEAVESGEFQNAFKGKKTKEMNRIAANLETTRLPFTDQKVPEELVENLALANLREIGYMQFWLESKRIEEMEIVI